MGVGARAIEFGTYSGYRDSVFILGNENTNIIDIKSDSIDESTYGIILTGGKDSSSSYMNITSKLLRVDAKNEQGDATGIHVANYTFEEEKPENSSLLEINSEKTIIRSDNVGISAFSNGTLKVKGDLDINAKVAISTRGYSLIEVNKNKDKTIKLNGDITFDRADTPVESDIILNLSNKESVFNGAVYTVYAAEHAPKPNEENEDLKYSGMKLGLSNGGTWNVTGDSLVNDLVLDNGVINIKATTGDEEAPEGDVGDYTGVKDGKTVLNVDNLSGKGAVNFEAIASKEGIEVAEGNLRVRSGAGVAKGTALKVGLSGVNADDLVANDIGAEKALGELVGKVTGSGVDNITQTAVIERGALIGEITAELNKDGFTNMKQAQDTPTTVAIRDLTAINFLSWKQEMSRLSQRMGELRDSSAEHGVWARVYGGKVENGSQYDNEYQTYQVGYDKKYTVDNGRVYLGYLVSYTDGETDYSYGTGENYSVGAGIYATWMNNNGHYVDILYKVSRLNNKFDMKDVEDVKGDYDTYGISLSAEYGKRFDITDKWFAEPSVGMHLGRLGDEIYTTDGGIEISQDSIYTAEGRVGAAVGYKFSDKGNIYVRTHVVKEFAGEVDTEYERKGVYASTSEDFGDTWFKFGIGVNYRFTENMNVYADIERTGDSTVDTKWQGNLGFRYEF